MSDTFFMHYKAFNDRLQELERAGKISFMDYTYLSNKLDILWSQYELKKEETK